MKVLLTLHIIAAVFLIGPLVAAGTSGIRFARSGDAGALRVSSRTVTVYGWASLAVLVLGASMVQGEDSDRGHSFSDGWIVASVILFLAAFAIVMAVLAPALRAALRRAESGESSAGLAGRIAASAGVVSVLYLILAVLMVYGP